MISSRELTTTLSTSVVHVPVVLPYCTYKVKDDGDENLCEDVPYVQYS